MDIYTASNVQQVIKSYVKQQQNNPVDFKNKQDSFQRIMQDAIDKILLDKFKNTI